MVRFSTSLWAWNGRVADEGNTSGSCLLILDGAWVATTKLIKKSVSNLHCDFVEDKPLSASSPRNAKLCKQSPPCFHFGYSNF